VAEEGARVIGCIKELVEGYNEDFANELGQASGPAPEGLGAAKPPNFIDTPILEKDAILAARPHTAFLVDMARAEALDAMGETEKATRLVNRYIQPS
jgi:hypothetical protein